MNINSPKNINFIDTMMANELSIYVDKMIHDICTDNQYSYSHKLIVCSDDTLVYPATICDTASMVGYSQAIDSMLRPLQIRKDSITANKPHELTINIINEHASYKPLCCTQCHQFVGVNVISGKYASQIWLAIDMLYITNIDSCIVDTKPVPINTNQFQLKPSLLSIKRKAEVTTDASIHSNAPNNDNNSVSSTNDSINDKLEYKLSQNVGANNNVQPIKISKHEPIEIDDSIDSFM